MAVREFTDSRGIEWRVWDVTPQHMHPITRSEDYMSRLQDGWLAFDSGKEKRRLEAPYPSQWLTLGIPALEALCRTATPVMRRTAPTDTGKQRAVRTAEIEQTAVRDADALRTIKSSGGREWTVRLHEFLDRAGEERVVLRFTTGDIVIDLARWPDGWRDATTEQFALMMLDADPPRRRGKGEGPQRRSEDRVMPDDYGSIASVSAAR